MREILAAMIIATAVTALGYIVGDAYGYSGATVALYSLGCLAGTLLLSLAVMGIHRGIQEERARS